MTHPIYIYTYIYIYMCAYIYNQSLTDNVKVTCFSLEMGTMWLTGKPSVAWHCIGKMFLTFWHLSKDSSTGHNWITIFDSHKKDFCSLISYLSFLCISISVVVPSGNSSIRLGVEHCISTLQVVEEFDRRNGLNPCRQHEVIFTWFTRYSFLQFANCREFISHTSSIRPVRAEQ